MSSEGKRGLPAIALLAGAVVFFGGAFFLYQKQKAEFGEFRQELSELKVDARELGMRSEALIGDLANLRVERNVLREKLAQLETRSAETDAALSQALADLERTRRERDEHQAKRLMLERRLEDALVELSKGK